VEIRADAAEAARYRAEGWWGDDTIGTCVRRWASEKGDATAFVSGERRFTWTDYDLTADALARVLLAGAPSEGERVAVLMPDGPGVHAAFVAVERAGLVVVGIGHRAGDREIAHLLSLTGATVLVTVADHRGRAAAQLRDDVVSMGAGIERLVIVDVDGAVVDPGLPDEVVPDPAAELAAPDPDGLFLLNSTSGTTGLPKCVMHTQNRWFYFHRLAAAAGDFGDDEVFLSAIPAPFGFGLWTGHFTPAILGAPTIVMERFDADEALDLIERERVTVLCCVSTQFIMMLNANAERPRDLSSLRSMFTGGEAVPFERAAAFEDVTGAKVLQFYGSNETGALSHTTVHDDREHRFGTAGRVIDDMHVRLLDPETFADVPDGVREGQPACKGPATCLGYWGDEAANTKLFTDDGWMLMGDIVSIDDDGYLSVIGRTSDFIIRGGKNISAPAVEAELTTHPDVAMVAAVA
jgi:acyl-CoA synthetase